MTFVDEARKVAEGATEYADENTVLYSFMHFHWDAMVDVVEAAGILSDEPFGQLKARDFYKLREARYRLEAITKETPDA